MRELGKLGKMREMGDKISIAHYPILFPIPYSLFPVPCSLTNDKLGLGDAMPDIFTIVDSLKLNTVYRPIGGGDRTL